MDEDDEEFIVEDVEHDSDRNEQLEEEQRKQILEKFSKVFEEKSTFSRVRTKNTSILYFFIFLLMVWWSYEKNTPKVLKYEGWFWI